MHNTAWCGMLFAMASKSNIVAVESFRSAIRIGVVEEAADVRFYGVLERRKSTIVAGGAQPLGLRLGEVLIAATDFTGHVDVFDVRLLAERGVAGEHQFTKAARLA